MKPKFLAGPWTVGADAEGYADYFSVWYDEGGSGAEIAGRIGEPAAASLIAAAPAMRTALERAVDACEAEWQGDEEPAWMVEARAALAAADKGAP